MGRPRPGLSDSSKSILNRAVLEAYLELRTHIQDSWRILQVLEALQFTRQSQQQPARDRAASGRRKSGSKSARKNIFLARKNIFLEGRGSKSARFFSRATWSPIYVKPFTIIMSCESPHAGDLRERHRLLSPLQRSLSFYFQFVILFLVCHFWKK